MLESRTINDQATRLRQIASRSYPTIPPINPHVITITSGKGGVGKSMIALNLSLALCALGKRVLLLDADTNLGSLDLLLGLAPQFRLGHVLRGERDVEDVLVSPVPHLKLLPGSSGDPGYPLMNPETQNALVANLKQLEDRSDYIIIDTAAGLTSEIIGYAAHADETVVVSRPEPTAVMDAYAMIKVIHLTKPGLSIKVLMNAVREPGEGDDAAAKLVVAVNRFLKTSFTYLGAIPYDELVVRSIQRQKAVFQEFPTSSVSLTVKAIAQRFLDQST